MITSLSSKNPLVFVRAWSNDHKLVLEQIKVKKGTNEITTIPEVLDRLNLKNKVVTIDAIGTQINIVDLISRKKGDYVLALKKNQHQLYDDVSRYMDDVASNQITDSSVQYYKQVDYDHGRQDKRVLGYP